MQGVRAAICRFGKDFGGNYIVELVSAAPRVRIRSSRDRQQDQLADLAVLNERLAGDAGLVRPWEVCTPVPTGSVSTPRFATLHLQPAANLCRRLCYNH